MTRPHASIAHDPGNTAVDKGAAVPESDLDIALPGGEVVLVRQYGQRQAGAKGQPLVLHFHGGAFTQGCLDCSRPVGRMLAKAGALVVSIAYPLAPEHPFPAPVEVGYAVLEWLHKQRTKLAGKDARLYVAGDEAGGNLAAALCMVARDRGHPPLAGQLLLSPMLDPCAGTASLRAAACETTDVCKWAQGWQQYLPKPMDALHPYAVPGASLRLRDLPPTLVLVGAKDPMHDEALNYVARLRDAGLQVHSHTLDSAARWPEALYDLDASGCVGCEGSVVERFRDFFAQTSEHAPTHTAA